MKNEFKIRINTIDRVKRLVNITMSYDEDIDISSGRYIIDGKSIMGIFSFDLTKPLVVHIHSNDETVVRNFNKDMEMFKYED